MPNELKPCPFCGGTPRVVENKLSPKDIRYGVFCGGYNHEASVGWFTSEDEGIEIWNRRANDDPDLSND